MKLSIPLNDLPPEGKRFSGEIHQDIFGLTGEDDPQKNGPVLYDLRVRLNRNLVVIEGRVEADFLLECSRCVERFPYHLDLSDYYSEEPREGAAILDLTARLREDIILALPGYPHCEESNVISRTCPAAGRFAPASEFVPISEEDVQELKRSDIWDVLDEVKTRMDSEKR